MSKIVVEYLGFETEAFYYGIEYGRYTSRNGYPGIGVNGGAVHLQFNSSPNTLRFLEEMLQINERFNNEELENPADWEAYRRVLIKIYDADGYIIRHIELLDTYISNYRETLELLYGSSNVVSVVFRSATQVFNKGVARWSFLWKLTDFIQREYRSPIVEFTGNEETNERRVRDLRVELELSSQDEEALQQGEFGFHKILPRRKVINRSRNYPELERQHQLGLTQRILNEPYYPHWLSMRVGDRRTFTVNFKGGVDRYNQVGFRAHPDFRCTPEFFTSEDTVTIECLRDAGDNTEGVQLRIMGDNTDVVGAINIFYPRPKSIDVEWVVVEKKGGREDRRVILETVTIDRQIIQEWLDKAFRQTLIDVRVINEEAEEVDISNLSVLHRFYRERIRDGFLDFEKARVVDAEGQRLVNMIAAIDHIRSRERSNGEFEPIKPLRLYFTYFASYKEDSQGNKTEYVNGVSPTGHGIGFMLMNSDRQEPETVVPHEEIFHRYSDLQ